MTDNGTQKGFAGYEEPEEDVLHTQLDDALREELAELMGTRVVGMEMYEESLGDDEDEAPVPAAERVVFDCDLLLEDGQALELYVVAAYPDPDGDPVKGMDSLFDTVGRLVDEGMALLDFDDADEEGGLALAFGQDDSVQMVLVANAWVTSEWESDEDEGEEEENDEEAV